MSGRRKETNSSKGLGQKSFDALSVEGQKSPASARPWREETEGRRSPLDVVARLVHPALKELGFRRKGRTWNRATGDVVHVISLESTMYNRATTDAEYLFFVGVGVAVPAFLKDVRREPAEGFLRLQRAQLNSRLHQLRGREVTFQALDPECSLSDQSATLAGVLLAEVVPALNSLASIPSIAEEVERLSHQTVGKRWDYRPEFLEYVRRYGKPAAAPLSRRLIEQRDPSPLVLSLLGCDGLATDTDTDTDTASAIALLRGVASDAGLSFFESAAANTPFGALHIESDTWKRQKGSRRKLSRLNRSEDWSLPIALQTSNGHTGTLRLSRYGRDNWCLQIHVSLTEHKRYEMTVDEFASPWIEALTDLGHRLQDPLRPGFGALLATSSYWDLLEDVEQNRLVVGYRTWFGEELTRLLGREFLLGLPSRAKETEAGGIFQEISLSSEQMVLPKANKFRELKQYLRAKGIQPAWPR